MTTHTLPAGTSVHANMTAVARAMQAAGYTGSNDAPRTSFHFDLIEAIKSTQHKRLKDAWAGRVLMSLDGSIQAALGKMLADYYKHSQVQESKPTFASYGDFLHHIEGLTHAEQFMADTGLDVTPSVERVRTLVALRNEVNDIIGNDPDLVRSRYEKVVDGIYTPPTVADMLRSPRMRKITAADEEQLRLICEDDYPDDAEMRLELFEQYKLDQHMRLVTEHKFALDKADSLVVLFACIGADDQADITDEDDAFYNLDARTQRNLLRTSMRVIADTRRDAVLDNRLSTLDKAALRVEAKSVMATLTVALDHESFANIDS